MRKALREAVRGPPMDFRDELRWGISIGTIGENYAGSDSRDVTAILDAGLVSASANSALVATR